MYRGKFDAKNKGAGMTDLPKRAPQQQEMPGRNPAPQAGRPMPQQQGRPVQGQQPGRPNPNGRPMPNQQPGRPNPNGRPAPQQQGRPMPNQ